MVWLDESLYNHGRIVGSFQWKPYESIPLSPFLYLIVAEGFSRMMERAVKKGNFSPLKVGRDRVEISHLQYADDTIIFGEAKMENIGLLKCVLRCFKLYSGLKVNFHKSCLIGVGVEVCESWAKVLNCNLGSIPFVYLGLPIGAKSNDKQIWSKVIEKLEGRLANWENNFLSFGASQSGAYFTSPILSFLLQSPFFCP